MADEQYRWLDRATAERLLSGEPPEAVDPAAQDQARRLAGTLRALSAPSPADGEELPGEAAALAAFRKVGQEKEGRTEPAPPAGTRPSDVGLFRIGAPRGDRSGTPDGRRRARPLRLGLAAALVVGMAGGAAVLAGTGLLSGPSDDSPSGPAASATGTRPEQPLLSPPPESGAAGGVTPEGEHPESAAGTAGGDADAGGPGAPGRDDADSGEGAVRSGRGWKQLSASCRALRAGETLNGERRHALENAAGGSSHVGTYCDGVLSTSDPSGGNGTSGASGGSGGDENAHPGNGNGQGNANGGGQGKGNGKGNGQNKGHDGQGRAGGAEQGNSPKKSDYDDEDSDDQGGDEDGNGNGKGNGNGNSQ